MSDGHAPPDQIVIRGAREHNLKNLNLTIPKQRLVAITGRSGAGKSSLAFDTIYAEGRRRYVESLSAQARLLLGDLRRPDVDLIEGLAPAIAIDQRGEISSPRSTVGTTTEIYDLLRLLFARAGRAHCPQCDAELQRHTPQQVVDLLLALPEGSRLLILAPAYHGPASGLPAVLDEIRRQGFVRLQLNGALYELDMPLPEPLPPEPLLVEVVVDRVIVRRNPERSRLSDSVETALKIGGGLLSAQIVGGERLAFSERYACPNHGPIAFGPFEPRDFSFNSPHGACPTCTGLGQLDGARCPACGGARLRPELRAVRFADQRIADLSAQTIADLAQWSAQPLAHSSLSPREAAIAAPIRQAIAARLDFLLKVGLGYLTIDRPAASLSGGEAQRLRLAGQVGGGLSGVLYVLDEPSVGLHPRDHEQLLAVLRALRDLGNSVLVVEHELAGIRAADWIVDIGPEAGAAGGELLAEGDLAAICAAPRSLTGAYLSGQRQIATPRQRRTPSNGWLRLRGARANNLKSLTLELPLGCLVGVSGVSGSGKSSLIMETLYPLLANQLHGARLPIGPHDALEGLALIERVVAVDQSPIGRSPRSNPATYAKLFDPLRQLFAQLPEANLRGYESARFSFNVKGGRCEHCLGEGQVRVEMQFLPDLLLPCDVCAGARYNRETLEIRYRGRNIAEILAMTVSEASEFFSRVPQLAERLQTLEAVGLGYLHLGQPAPTLSGGEAQRLKLAAELGRRGGRSLYILDEPTGGLHIADVAVLIGVLQRLVDAGNTVLVIEHDLDLLRCADWLVEIGPEAGTAGGELLVAGPPELVAAHPSSHTARYLRAALAEAG